MDKLVSCWYTEHSLPKNYILPEDIRPGNLNVPPSNTLPVIDLSKIDGHDRRTGAVEKIFKASQEFGFFQVINHGISRELLHDTMDVFKEFFNMPVEDKARFYSEDPKQSCRLYTSSTNYANEEFHYWRDNLRHPCHPLDEWNKFWPQKPTRYREVVGKYSLEVRRLSLSILELICEGLGLEEGYFGDELSEEQLMPVNYYPPCPDPSVTLGLPKHCDPSLITILQQGDVYGLQIFKDGQWIGVVPIPDTFVINIGYQLQVISNGKLKSAEHRVITNSTKARTTIATFINPSHDTTVQPTKSLVSEHSPPLYKAFKYKDFLANYTTCNGDNEAALKPFKLQS